MKIHITNLYNFNPSDELVRKQHRFAEAGRSLGFLEMGIFAYPVETDTPSELSKRLDGVIAALEPEDVVFVQLPTENGYAYESMLVQKIKAYRDTGVALVFHDEVDKEGYRFLCELADVVLDGKTGNVSSLQKFLLDGVEKLCAAQLSALPNELLLHEEEIQVGFGLYDKTGNYSVWVGTVMQSIVENTCSPICFHILHDETLSQANRSKLMQVAVNNGHRVLFHFLDKDIFTGVAEQTRYFTIGTMFRIMLPELLPDLKKIIYLDADLLVNRDIKELWDVDISDYCLAAAPDVDVVSGLAKPLPVRKGEVEAERYFNAGVLVLNLENIRKKGNLKEDVLEYLRREKEAILPDQDALNVLYNKDTLLLDNSWNYFTLIARRNAEKTIEKRIYHYAATRCVLYSLTAVDRLYYETICRTPWGVEEGRRQLSLAFERIRDRVEQLEKIISCVSDVPKKYIFYGAETFAMKNLYALLPPKIGDYRVLSVPVKEENVVLECRQLETLKAEREPFLLFVLPDADGGRAMENLDKLGLQNGKDYFVIPRILPPDKGGYM